MGPHGEREKISDPDGGSNPRPPEQITVALPTQLQGLIAILISQDQLPSSLHTVSHFCSLFNDVVVYLISNMLW